jgi:hypothetical protein
MFPAAILGADWSEAIFKRVVDVLLHKQDKDGIGRLELRQDPRRNCEETRRGKGLENENDNSRRWSDRKRELANV